MRAPHRVIACAALGLAWIGAAGAADTLADCRDIREDAARLTCYDALAGGKSLPPAAAPAGVALSSEEMFGQRSEDVVKRTTGVEPLDELTSKVTEVRASPSGKLVLALDNGQVWSQADTASFRIKPGEEVRIRRGALGSYLLTRKDGGAAIRVRRTQ